MKPRLLAIGMILAVLGVSSASHAAPSQVQSSTFEKTTSIKLVPDASALAAATVPPSIILYMRWSLSVTTDQLYGTHRGLTVTEAYLKVSGVSCSNILATMYAKAELSGFWTFPYAPYYKQVIGRDEDTQSGCTKAIALTQVASYPGSAGVWWHSFNQARASGIKWRASSSSPWVTYRQESQFIDGYCEAESFWVYRGISGQCHVDYIS